MIDSDATNFHRHVGLGKSLAQGHLLSETGADQYPSLTTKVAQGVISGWFNIFQDRWHDAIATLAWVVAWLSMIVMAYMTIVLVCGNHTAGLGLAYVLSSLPLLGTHVMRPGFADLFVAMFLTVAACAYALYLYRVTRNELVYCLMGLSILGCAMIKLEGAAWGMVMLFTFLSVFVHRRWGIPYGRIIGMQSLMLLLGFSVFFVTADWILENLDVSDVRLVWLLTRTFDPRSFDAFFGDVFTHGSFSILWWFTFGLSAILLFKAKQAVSRVPVFCVTILFLGVFYYANFGGAVTYTLQGTNVGRFLLHLTPLSILIFSAFSREFLSDQSLGFSTQYPGHALGGRLGFRLCCWRVFV